MKISLILLLSLTSLGAVACNGDPGDEEKERKEEKGKDQQSAVFDCSTVPKEAISVKTVPNATGYHGLAISSDGKMIGSDGSALVQVTYDGEASVLTPGVGDAEQMDWLPNGDLAVGTYDGILRIEPSGAKSVLAGDVSPYGVVVGPDGFVYATGNESGAIWRIDPETGEKEVLRDAVFDLPDVPFQDDSGSDTAGDSALPIEDDDSSNDEDWDDEDWDAFEGKPSPHSLGFSLDGKRLYVGTVTFTEEGDYAPLLAADIDDDGKVGEFVERDINVGKGWHDAIEVDACGNLYVPDFESGSLFRVTPTGQVAEFWAAGEDKYPHSLVWGTGKDGWRSDALYASQPYNDYEVVEIVVGAPSRKFEGTVKNGGKF